MQGSFWHLIWSLHFFYFEVIFHMLFQFGTEEFAGSGPIHRNNSALVLNWHPIEPHKYLIWPHGAVIEPYIRSYEVSMHFYEISIKYQSWVVSVNCPHPADSSVPNWNCMWKMTSKSKKNFRDQIEVPNAACMQKIKS